MPRSAVPAATIRQIAGLYTSPNPFSHAPEGALAIADEVMIRGAGVLEPRRGMGPSANAWAADRAFPLPNTRKVVTTARTATAPSVWDPDADTVVALTRSGGNQPLSYPYSSDARTSVWGASANGNLYLSGVQGLAAVGGQATTSWRAAGLPRPTFFGLGNYGGDDLLYGPRNMGNNLRRTYRVTIAWYDPLGNFYESEPSAPQAIDNTSGGNIIPLFFFFYPPMTPLGAFFRIWRAVEVVNGTQSSDEMFLVREFIDPNQAAGPDGYATTSGGAFNGFYPQTPSCAITVGDVSIDSLLNVPLYTNPQTGDGLGILSANARPPASSCVAWFKSRMYYGRPTFQQLIVLQVIGTGAATASASLRVGDTITIDGLTYTGVTDLTGGNPTNSWAPNSGGLATTFFVRTAGTVSNNIEITARSICDAINGLAIYRGQQGIPPQRLTMAYYASSGVNDFGRIVIFRPVPSPTGDDPGIPITVSSSSGGLRYPLGSTTSTDSYSAGGLAWSKFNQPEAVPAVNFANLGDPSKTLLGFAVLRDSMIVFKEDGAFIVYDNGGPQPVVQVLDPSAITIAPQSIAVLNNAAYCYTGRGVLQVTEQATIPVSGPLRTDLQTLLAQNQSMDALAFGVAYESERFYILGVPSSASENACSLQYVLKVAEPPLEGSAWTRWLLPGVTSGLVLPAQQRLAFTFSAPLPTGNVVTGVQANGVLYERKGGVVSTDYADVIGSLPAATYTALSPATAPAGAPPAVTARATLTYAQDMHQQVFEGDLLLFQYLDGVDSKNHAQWARVTSVAKAVVSIDTASLVTADGTTLMGRAPTYYRAIQAHWRYVAQVIGEPEFEKQWRYTQHHLDYCDGDWIDVLLDTEKSGPRGFSQCALDPQIVNTSGTMGATPWLRQTRNVIVRLDPAQAEARGARLGIEMLFAQARARFRIVSTSAHAHEWKEASTR